jgi:methylmalonyl-CoA/ethylmalonyl-CoA epimerase
MFTKLDHVGVMAHSWEEAKAHFTDIMGMPVDLFRTPMPEGSYMAPENVRIYFFRIGDGETLIEVLIPLDDASGTAKLLARRGPGLHHLGYASDNWQEDARRLRALGLRQVDLTHGKPELVGRPQGAAFFHPKSAMGILTEIVPHVVNPWQAPTPSGGPGPSKRVAQHKV